MLKGDSYHINFDVFREKEGGKGRVKRKGRKKGGKRGKKGGKEGKKKKEEDKRYGKNSTIAC